jgi:galactokinase
VGVERVRSFAPGRVNLIGDHTDYMGGLVLPMAIELGTTVQGIRSGLTVELRSEQLEGAVRFALPVIDPAAVTPEWGRYVAGVAARVEPSTGLVGTITSTVPLGSGLSSSAALEVATALALGDTGSPLEVARRCQLAEQSATGVPCGIMDQLASTAGVSGHALLIDCSTTALTPVPVAEHLHVWVVHSGQDRRLAGSAYAQRRSECERAESLVGALPTADPGEIERIADPVVRARARHVRSECARVRAFADALARDDPVAAGTLMYESHRSLRDDFAVSSGPLDEIVERLRSTPGVHGARLTGAGFGGCVVALAEPGVQLPGRRVRPSDGAHVELVDGG